MKFRVRKIRQSTFTRDFFTLLGQTEAGGHYEPRNRKHVAWVRECIASLYGQGCIFLACYCGKHPAGFIIIDIPRGLPGFDYGMRSEIAALAVHPEYRRKGVASLLLKQAARLAKSRKLPCLYVTTYSRSRIALACYRNSTRLRRENLARTGGELALNAGGYRCLLPTREPEFCTWGVWLPRRDTVQTDESCCERHTDQGTTSNFPLPLKR